MFSVKNDKVPEKILNRKRQNNHFRFGMVLEQLHIDQKSSSFQIS